MATLASRIESLATAVGTALKSTRTLINGNASTLNALSTTVKTDLVAAINELDTDKVESSLIITDLGPTQTAGKLFTLGAWADAIGYWPEPIKYNTSNSTWPARNSVVPAWYTGPARWEALTTVGVADPVGLVTGDLVVDLYAA